MSCAPLPEGLTLVTEPLRLSPSAISTYRRCSLQYWFAYVAGVRLKPRGAMTQGRAVHKGIEVALGEVLEAGALPPVSVVQDVVVEEFDRLLPETYWDDSERPDVLRAGAVRLATLHHARVAPRITPVLVEHRMEAVLPTVVGPTRLVMVVDVVEPDAVRDTKVSTRRVDPAYLRTDFQLQSYAVAAEGLGIRMRAVRVDRLIDAREPQVQSVEMPVRDADRGRVAAVVNAVAAGITAGVYVPVDDIRICGWCGYRPICWGKPWWRYLVDPEEARKAARQHLASMLVEDANT